jgi:hypothetical protein
LCHDEYFGLRDELADSPSGFDAVQLGKADIEQNQVRFQFHRFYDGF